VDRGVIEGLSSMEGDLPPMVIRLEGTNADEAKRILEESDLSFEVAGSLAEAAEMVVTVSA